MDPTKTKTATITVSKERPTTLDNFAGGKDYDVLVSIDGEGINGEITLAPDDANGGRMTAHGGSIDSWCSDSLVRWMRTLTPQSVRAVASLLQGGEGTEDVGIEVDKHHLANAIARGAGTRFVRSPEDASWTTARALPLWQATDIEQRLAAAGIEASAAIDGDDRSVAWVYATLDEVA